MVVALLALIPLVLLAAGIASWFLWPAMWARLLLSVARRAAGLESRVIEVEGIRWHYLQGGSGPTLLLAHGFGGSADNWIRIAPLLRPRFRLLIPDLPGFGDSASPDGLRFDSEAQAARLSRFLDALDVRECLVAGNSMGGHVATTLAVREPGRIRALWLLAPLGVRAIAPGEVLQSIDSGDRDYLEISSAGQFRQRVVSTMFASKVWMPGPLLKVLAASAAAIRHEAPRMLREARFESEALESLARRVPQPVLLQWGEEDRVVNPAGLPVLANAFANSHSARLAGCGHLPMFERPRASAELFIKFAEDNNLLRAT